MLAGGIGFAVYLRLSYTESVNSDGSSQALQAWDILHGNLLLHGWQLRDASLITLDTFEYAAIESLHGLATSVVHIGAAASYTLAVLLAAALAKGAATGRRAAVRVTLAAGIMLAPQLGAGVNVLLASPDHTATSVPVLLALLILDRLRPRWYVPVAVTVLLAWAVIGDQVVLVAAIGPVATVSAVRIAQARIRDRSSGRGWRATLRDTRRELALAAGAGAAGVVGVAAPAVIQAIGGYGMMPLDASFASPGTIVLHNIPVLGEGILLLSGAYFPALPPGAQLWLAVPHLAGAVLVVGGVVVTAQRFFRGEELVPQLLLAGIVLNVAAYVLGTHAYVFANTREIAVVLPLAAALAGRRLPGRLARLVSGWTRRVRLRATTTAVVVLAFYGAGLGLELAAPAPPQGQARLIAWLAGHHLGTGLSGYWLANALTLASGGRAPVRCANERHGLLVPGLSNGRPRWFDPRVSSADYVVLGPAAVGYPGDPEYPGFSGGPAAIATFGKPWRVYRVGGYTILRWRENLLAHLPARPGQSLLRSVRPPRFS